MRDMMLILHFIGLAMGLGTSFAHAFFARPVSKMQPEEATKFRINLMVLSQMGYTGLTLLLISGAYLITPFLASIENNPWLIVKLSLVLLLIILLFFIGRGARRALHGNADEHMKKIEPLGKMTLVISLAIVIIAVKIFH